MTKEENKKISGDLSTRKDFIRSVGRRKCAVAQVRLFEKGKGNIVVNDMPVKEYFEYYEWIDIIDAPLKESALDGKVDLSVKVNGGGKKSQAEAVRLGIARSIVKIDEAHKKALRARGFMTRDSRVKERKKPGLKRARRAPQWSKR